MKAYQTLIFLCSVLALIVGICLFFPEGGIEVCGKVLRFPTLTEAMTKKSQDKETADEKLRKAEEEMKLQIQQDSIRQEMLAAEVRDSLAYVDTLKSYKNLIYKTVARIECPNEDISTLFPLFDLLDECAQGKESIHILHYGDSQIEQDRISGYIRERFQEKFGGWGVGLAPAIQPIPSISVSQSASDSLPRYIADGNLRKKLSHDRYGVLAQMAQLNGKVRLNFASRNWKKTFPHTKKFSKITLLVGNTSEDFSATLSYNGKDSTQTISDFQPELSVITWKLGEFTSKVSLNLSGKAEIYGVSLESPSGVFVDNIPLRGSSGTFFTKISQHILSSSMKAINTGLIIMEFGGNATPYLNSDKGVEYYKKNIIRQIDYLHKTYPEAKILLIGPADMSTRVAGEMQTYPFLETTIEAMKEAAIENNAMFWNMYEVMGGHNSMLKWVEHQPAWAASDYIHFTEQGAEKIADVFVQSFFNAYDYYHFLKRNTKWSGVE